MKINLRSLDLNHSKNGHRWEEDQYFLKCPGQLVHLAKSSYKLTCLEGKFTGQIRVYKAIN